MKQAKKETISNPIESSFIISIISIIHTFHDLTMFLFPSSLALPSYIILNLNYPILSYPEKKSPRLCSQFLALTLFAIFLFLLIFLRSLKPHLILIICTLNCNFPLPLPLTLSLQHRDSSRFVNYKSIS